MIRRLLATFVVIALLGGCAPSEQRILSTIPEAPQLSLPEPVRFTLPNGLQVVYFYDNELPTISVKLIVPGGRLFEPPHLRGASEAMGAMLREGGTRELSPDELDLFLEVHGISLGSNFGDELGNVSASGLLDQAENVMHMLSSVALTPRFDRQRFELWKFKQQQAIHRRREDSQSVAVTSLRQLLFHGTPFDDVKTTTDIAALKESSLRDAHRYFMRPRGSYLVVSGALSREQLQPLLDRYMSGWRPDAGEGASLVLPARPKSLGTPGLYFVELPFEQAIVIAGEPGPRRFDEHHFPIQVFNHVFGSARIAQRIRTEMGLAYSTAGAVSPGAVVGFNYVFFGTKNESVGPALDAGLGVIDEMQRQLIAPEELRMAKATVENAHIFKFESLTDVAERAVTKELLAFPPNYDATFLDKVRAVTADDVRTVARDLWSAKDFVIVVVGKGTAYNSLKQLTEKSGGLLSGLPIKRLRFREKLEL